MASKSQQTPSRKSDVRFVNYDFDETTKKAFKKWAHENSPEMLNYVDKVVDSGLSVSIKRDNRNECYSAFIVRASSLSDGASTILAGRGASSFGALAGVLYRHLVIFEGNWEADDYRRIGLDDE